MATYEEIFPLEEALEEAIRDIEALSDYKGLDPNFSNEFDQIANKLISLRDRLFPEKKERQS